MKKIIILALLIILGVSGYFLYDIYFSNNLKLEYNSKTIEKMKELNILNEVMKMDKYSKTLDVAINSEYYFNENFKYYKDINYKDYSNLIDYINSLITIGYSVNEINNIFDYLNEDNINIILNYNYSKHLNNYFMISYFRETNLERYLQYEETSTMNTEDILTWINIGLDYPFYTNIKTVDNPNDIEVYINKYNKLPDDFIPNNLRNINSNYTKWGINLLLVDVAAESFELMADSAKEDNINLKAQSTYRSYAEQKYTYDNYVIRDGVLLADTYSARPGHSEHQTGLVIDCGSDKFNYNEIEGTEVESWLRDNAYKYGFIIRFPKAKEDITGYKYEPWHLRYVGIELSTKIYNSDLTFEEYLARN